MRKTILRKLACIGLLVAAAAVSACGSANKVAVVDVQKVQQDSARSQSIQNRLTTDSQAGLSDEDMQKKVPEALQERMIFVQSKQKQIQSMVETQSAAVAKEKNIGIVMHKRVVPAGAVDITDEVLKKLNGVSDPSSTDKKSGLI